MQPKCVQRALTTRTLVFPPSETGGSFLRINVSGTLGSRWSPWGTHLLAWPLPWWDVWWRLVAHSTRFAWPLQGVNLKCLVWFFWELLHLQVGVSIVSLPAIQSSDYAYDQCSSEGQNTSIIDGSQGIDLCSSNVCLMLVMDSTGIFMDMWNLFSSNQLSIWGLKSMWSPKFPGLAEVLKN